MTSAVFVLLLFKGSTFVGYHAATFDTREGCVIAGSAMKQHKYQCIQLNRRSDTWTDHSQK